MCTKYVRKPSVVRLHGLFSDYMSACLEFHILDNVHKFSQGA